MQRLQTLQPLPERGAQPLIRLRLIRKNGVPARVRHIQRVQERRPGRLVLVRHVAVPRDAVGTVVEEGPKALVLRAAVHEVHFGVALGGAGGRVDVQAAEVFDVLEGVWDGESGEVLVAESDDFLLGDEEGEFVLTFGGELGELDAGDFGANGGGDVLDDGRGGREQVGKGWVGVFTVFVVLEGLEGCVSGEWGGRLVGCQGGVARRVGVKMGR
jgi:hypothetical protein